MQMSSSSPNWHFMPHDWSVSKKKNHLVKKKGHLAGPDVCIKIMIADLSIHHLTKPFLDWVIIRDHVICHHCSLLVLNNMFFGNSCQCPELLPRVTFHRLVKGSPPGEPYHTGDILCTYFPKNRKAGKISRGSFPMPNLKKAHIMSRYV